MIFFYWFKKFIKSFLYSMPKGFLVFLVIFLLLLLFNPNSKGAFVPVEDTDNVILYDYIDIAGIKFDTLHKLVENNEELNVYLNASIDFSSWNNIISAGNFYLQSNSQNWGNGIGIVNFTFGFNGINFTRDLTVTNNTYHEYFYSPILENILEIDNVEVYRLGNAELDSLSLSSNILLNGNVSANSYKMYSFTLERQVDGIDICNYRACKYNGQVGIFDTVNNNFMPVSGVLGSPTGEVVGGGDTPDTPDTPENPDYSENFEEINNNLDNIENEIKDTNDKLDNVNNSINETNDFLQDTTVNDSDFVLPSLDVSDPTANFFDTVFMGLYNAITSDEEQTISFKVMDYDVVLNSADFNFLSSSGFSVLSSLLNTAWIFGIGMFILKDVRKIIETIKNGEIDKIGKTDIKADVM